MLDKVLATLVNVAGNEKNTIYRNFSFDVIKPDIEKLDRLSILGLDCDNIFSNLSSNPEIVTDMIRDKYANINLVYLIQAEHAVYSFLAFFFINIALKLLTIKILFSSNLIYSQSRLI